MDARIEKMKSEIAGKRTRNIGKDDNGRFIYDGAAPKYSSIDNSTTEGKKILFNLKNGKAINLSEGAKSGSGTIPVKDIVIYDGHIEGLDKDGNPLTDANGVIVSDSATKVFIITPDGTIYSTYSIGLVKSFQNLIEEFGNAPYEPAIDIQVYEDKTRDNNKIYKFNIV